MSDQSVDSMLQHASELLARYEFDAAHKFLRRALDLEPEVRRHLFFVLFFSYFGFFFFFFC